jgi:hypothetical protein
MTKKKFAAALIASFFVFTALPATTHAAESHDKKPKQSKKAAEAARKACENRIRVYGGFERDIKSWESYHYTMPTDLSAYTTKEVKQIDGVKRPTQSSEGKVTVYKNGKPVQVKKTNYVLVLQRHKGARDVAAAKVDVGAYTTSINGLAGAIEKAKTNASGYRGEWDKQFANVNCGTGQGQKDAKELTSLRSRIIKKLKSDLKDVKAASKNASKNYTAVAKAYKKKVAADTKAAAKKSTNTTGGTAAE